MIADRLADGIVTWKLVAFRFARLFRLMPFVPVVDVEGVSVVPLFVVVGVFIFVLILSCNWIDTLVGGLMPRVWERSLLTCMTAMSMMTSGRALSRSSTNFSAKAIWSGVPRTTRAFCESNC